MRRIRFLRLVAAMTVTALLWPGMASADTLDVLQGDNTIDLGAISPGGSNADSAALSVKCTGQGHADHGSLLFKDATITLNAGSSGSATEVSASPSLTIPSTWPTDDSKCGTPAPEAPGRVGIQATVPADAASGPRSLHVKLESSDPHVTNVVNITVIYTVSGGGGGGDTTAPSNASIVIDDGAAWTNNPGGGVTVDISAGDDAGVASYLLAESQAGLASATAHAVSPAEASFSRGDLIFVLTGLEDAAKSAWLRVCDAGGNCVDATDTIGWDATAPSISAAATKADLSPYTSGSWTNQNVTVGYECSDTLSGVAMGACPTPQTISSETTAAGLNVTGAVSDVAGNLATSNTINVKIDKTAPVVSVTGVTGGPYTLGSVPAAGCSTTDALSGVAAQATLNGPTGGTVNGVGQFFVECSGAQDAAENEADPVPASYWVHFVRDGGILQPINTDNTSLFSRGKAVPVKFRLHDDPAGGFNVAAWTLTRVSATCPGSTTFVTETVEGVDSVASGSFRYDATDDQYIFNADFSDMAAGTCWKVRVNFDDGTTMDSAIFKMRK